MADQQGSSALTQPRVSRVVVSSTFRDMPFDGAQDRQAERDVLIKRVLPQLRKRCEERAVSWTEVDLRWGTTDEETAEGKVLPLCQPIDLRWGVPEESVQDIRTMRICLRELKYPQPVALNRRSSRADPHPISQLVRARLRERAGYVRGSLGVC